MRSTRDDDNKPETAEQAPAQPHTPAPAGTTTAGLTLEERVERLEKRLVPIIGEL